MSEPQKLFAEPENQTGWGAVGAVSGGLLFFVVGVALPVLGFWLCSRGDDETFKCTPILALCPFGAIAGTLLGASLGSMVANRLQERYAPEAEGEQRLEEGA